MNFERFRPYLFKNDILVNGSSTAIHWTAANYFLNLTSVIRRLPGRRHESFNIAHKVLDPNVPEARYVTTAIHVKREVKPEYLLTPWYRQPRGSERRHFSLLHNWMGGYYPVDGQLEKCAIPYFSLQAKMDGSLGYKIANDYRMDRMLRGLYTNPKLVWRIVRCLARHPLVASTMIECYFIEKSWDWQFQGDNMPLKLLRHTWRRQTTGLR